MRDINFQEVGMENYGPYIEPMIHIFKNNTIVLMTGPNGIGKTMSLDALPYTLYGVTSKGAKGDDVVNNIVGKNCKTWVKFTINDDQYITTRYQKYTKLGNTVILNKNGVDIKSGHREVLPEIERLICPQKSFMNTLMFGQKVKDFFTDLVDSDKKEIFRKILNLELYAVYYKETDKKLKSIKNEIDNLTTQKKVKEGILIDVVEHLSLLKKLEKKFYKDQAELISKLKIDLEDNTRLSENWKKELSNLNQTSFNIDILIDELSEINSELNSLDIRYNLDINNVKSQKEQKKHELMQSADSAEKKIRDTTDISHKALKNIIDTLKIKQFELNDKHRKEIHSLQIKKNDLISENKSHTQRITEIKTNVIDKELSTCPICEQDVNEQIIESLLSKISLYVSYIKNNSAEIDNIEIQIQKSINEYKQIESDIKSQIENTEVLIKQLKNEEQKQYENINNRLNQTFQKVDLISKSQIDQFQEKANQEKKDLLQRRDETTKLKSEAISHQNKIDGIKSTIQDLDKRNSIITNNIIDEENKKYDTDQLNKYTQRQYDLKATINHIECLLKKLTERLSILEFWKTGFSSAGIPSMLIDESIPFMNKKVSKYLDMITNGRYIVSFDTLAETKSGEFRDKIAVRVLDTHTQANTRAQLSGGQTRIVDIATILTLGDLQSTIQDMKTNILLFDEIFDALDDENIGYVAKVLNKIKVGKAIFIITHQHQDQVEADQLLSLS